MKFSLITGTNYFTNLLIAHHLLSWTKGTINRISSFSFYLNPQLLGERPHLTQNQAQIKGTFPNTLLISNRKTPPGKRLSIQTSEEMEPYRSQIHTIQIANDISSLDLLVILDFPSLTTIKIGKSFKSLHPNTFSNCPKLEKIIISK